MGYKRLLNSQITDINLVKCEFTQSDFQLIVKTCNNLKKIHLDLTHDSMLKELCSNKHLTELKLVCTKQLSNKAIKLLADHCKKLKIVELRNSERINDKSI